MKQIKNYEGLVSRAYSLSFYGGSAEPLLAKQFGQIVDYVKSRYGTWLMVNTNASMLKGALLPILVDKGFDYIIVSFHAGTEDGYRALMTGNLPKIEANLKRMLDLKRERGKSKPKMGFNFALQRLNADEYEAILNKSIKLGMDHVIVNDYHGGRNKLQGQKVSFEYAVEEGNQLLDEIYEAARNKGVRLRPETPSYWRHAAKEVEWDPEDVDYDIVYQMPWDNIHFNPVLNRVNSHYVGVCNRAELFVVDYDKIDLSTPQKALAFWNHPLLQFLRRTVNATDDINPLCKYCKNRNRDSMRNVDATRYAEVRDTAVIDLFKAFGGTGRR